MIEKINFNRRLSSAYSPDGPTVIREYDSSGVDERLRQIRAVFHSLTESISQLESRVETANQKFEIRVRETAMQMVRGFALNDDAMIEKRLTQFFDEASSLFQSEEPAILFVNTATTELLPHLFEDESLNVAIDESLQTGECRLETGEQGLLMSLDAQLDAIDSYISRMKSGSSQ